MTKKILVIGAHSADFVWRAAGTIAVTTSQGGQASVIALSYGERGESGELWKEPNQTVENVKRIRHEEAKTAAEAVGAEFPLSRFGGLSVEHDGCGDRAVDWYLPGFPAEYRTHT